jgi:hypothetical protein
MNIYRLGFLKGDNGSFFKKFGSLLRKIIGIWLKIRVSKGNQSKSINN